MFSLVIWLVTFGDCSSSIDCKVEIKVKSSKKQGYIWFKGSPDNYINLSPIFEASYEDLDEKDHQVSSDIQDALKECNNSNPNLARLEKADIKLNNEPFPGSRTYGAIRQMVTGAERICGDFKLGEFDVTSDDRNNKFLSLNPGRLRFIKGKLEVKQVSQVQSLAFLSNVESVGEDFKIDITTVANYPSEYICTLGNPPTLLTRSPCQMPVWPAGENWYDFEQNQCKSTKYQEPKVECPECPVLRTSEKSICHMEFKSCVACSGEYGDDGCASWQGGFMCPHSCETLPDDNALYCHDSAELCDASAILEKGATCNDFCASARVINVPKTCLAAWNVSELKCPSDTAEMITCNTASDGESAFFCQCAFGEQFTTASTTTTTTSTSTTSAMSTSTTLVSSSTTTTTSLSTTSTTTSTFTTSSSLRTTSSNTRTNPTQSIDIRSTDNKSLVIGVVIGILAIAIAALIMIIRQRYNRSNHISSSQTVMNELYEHPLEPFDHKTSDIMHQHQEDATMGAYNPKFQTHNDTAPPALYASMYEEETDYTGDTYEEPSSEQAIKYDTLKASELENHNYAPIIYDATADDASRLYAGEYETENAPEYDSANTSLERLVDREYDSANDAGRLYTGDFERKNVPEYDTANPSTDRLGAHEYEYSAGGDV